MGLVFILDESLNHLDLHSPSSKTDRLKVMASPKLEKSIKVNGIDSCLHISIFTQDLVWIGNGKTIILTNSNSDLRNQEYLNNFAYSTGLHTVNSDDELIYIDKEYNIIKLSQDMEVRTTFIESTNARWRPVSLHFSLLTGDLLVGMWTNDAKRAKIKRYNKTGQIISIIQHDFTGEELYSGPQFITENRSGDVVVSDISGAVVVTDREGRHRFSYTGHPLGSDFQPIGICTDGLSHILVFDLISETIQMISEDGHFLLNLLTHFRGIEPRALCYDANTHRLWIGSGGNNTVLIYNYLTRQSTTSKCRFTV